MTKSEFAKFAMALRTYYPKEKLLPSEQAMDLWLYQLEDIPYDVAVAVLNEWVALNKWSPSIADIREMATSIRLGDMPSWGDAWEEVLKAIRQYGLYRADEAVNSLAPTAQKAIKRIGFTNICLSDNLTADRANFRQIYEAIAEREKKEAQLSPSLQTRIAELRGDYYLIEHKEDKEDEG